MIEIKLRLDGDWEIWQGGAIQHHGTLKSCGLFIKHNHLELEDNEEW
ncbi:hypothetical protein TMP248_140049 [Tenacibaculum maritimum]|nr:hypothetical protein [Tenacibaculum maritimum]CAA0173303.1 hypothetical protein TMP248_140049 [Tenacibaculum maritimum]